MADNFYGKYSANEPATVVTALNSLIGAVTLVAGTNITLTPSGNNITIAASGGGGVTTVNSLSGAVVFVAGTNITLTPVGNNITIDASGGGGGATTALDNLASVAINDVLYPEAGTNLRLRTVPDTGDTTDSISLATGLDSSGGAVNTGDVAVTTGSSLTGTTGSLSFSTGNADDSDVVGGVKVGNINFDLGTPFNDAGGGNFTVTIPVSPGAGSHGVITMSAAAVTLQSNVFDINLTSLNHISLNPAETTIMTGNSFRLPILDANPSSPVEGDCYYNDTAKKIKFYDGTTWRTVTST